MKNPITPAAIKTAYQTIKNDIYQTPLEYSAKLSEISGANVYLKMEQLQNSGSFKIRGVLNKLKQLKASDFGKTFVAASTGNHAAAFAHASQKFRFKGVIFMPEQASEAKIEALKAFDVQIIRYGKNSMETEARAAQHATKIGGILVHPYNDPEIIKGQGTIGIEIQAQLPTVNTVLAPIGGGGLISGLASYFTETSGVQVVGCQAVNAQEMYLSVKQGAIVPPSSLHTIADAAAGGIEANSLTFEICKKHLTGFELIAEHDIRKAVAFAVKHHHTIIEPGAVLPIAALLKSKAYKGKNVALVITGKKISHQLLTEILNQYGNNY